MGVQKMKDDKIKHKTKTNDQVVQPLTKINWPNPKENIEAIQLLNNDHTDSMYILKSRQLLQSSASQWKFLLSTNHCLLLYGFGSKRFLLNEFANELKSSGDVLTLDGNDPDIDIESILDVIVVRF